MASMARADADARTRALLRLASYRSSAVDDAGRVLVRTDRDGTWQLDELDLDGTLRPVTQLPEAADGLYVPGRRQAVVSVDPGGSELTQLYLADLDTPPARRLEDLDPLTADPGHAYQPAGVSPDGGLVAYTSNRGNGVDFDVWLVDLSTREHRCLYDGRGWCHPSTGFSPDGRWLSVVRPGPRPLDQDLLLVEMATGRIRVLDPHPDEAALVDGPAWLGPDTVLVASSVGRDTMAIVRFDLATGERTVLVEREWDLAAWASRNGSTVLVAANEDGATCGLFVDPATGAGIGELPLPETGVLGLAYNFPLPDLAADGSSVTFTFSSPVRPAGVWRFDTRAEELRALTPPAAIGPEALSTPERHRLTSFDGVELSAFVYPPTDGAERADAERAGKKRVPAVVYVHGGPEGQSMLSFSPLVQSFAAAGLAVVVPNVRGSTGYGKRFASLDDTTRRLDSVADLAAIHDWLPTIGLDPGRAALAGASYGGYMVLAGCAFQPERWSAGIDEVGIFNLETFLERTSDYRRAHREHEYGSLAHDREYLRAASPVHRVDAIRAPLWVIHGKNDPRVPLSETEQLVESLRARGVPCELCVYPDEGHGLARLANKLDAYPRAVSWLASVLS